MILAALPLAVALFAGLQQPQEPPKEPKWERMRVGTSPLSMEVPFPMVQAEDDAGLSVYTRNQDAKSWKLKFGSFEMVLQVFPKATGGYFDPFRALASAEALSKSIYGSMLNENNMSKANSMEGGAQVVDLMIAISDSGMPPKKVGYGYWAGWDGEWGCMARYTFEEKDLDTAQRIVSSRKFMDLASGWYRFQTGAPGLRMIVPFPLGAGEPTNMHNANWFDNETTFAGSQDGLVLRVTQMAVREGVKLDHTLLEKALKWQSEGQSKLPDVRNVAIKVDRAPLAGQSVVHATLTFESKGAKKVATSYAVTVGSEVWFFLAIRSEGDSKAEEAMKKVFDSAKALEKVEREVF
ncbi:MAG: hypothetical protein HZC36_16770 [Armatimonadetes bacterium]|nr:hypothetical protein [Armatimonadota bacterium]